MQEITLGKGLYLNAIRFPDKEALVFQEKRLTYSKLNARTNRLANGLIARGMKKGEKTAILLHNCVEFLEIFFGLAKVGILSVPLTYRAVARDLEYMVNSCDAGALIFGEEFEELVNEVRPQLSQVKNFFVIGRKPISWAENYEKLLSSASENEPEVEISEMDPLWITYTSGTTGAPKGCVGCHRGWVLQLPFMAMEFGVRQNDIYLSTGPLYHVGPCHMCLLFLYIGGTVVVMKEFDPQETLKIIEKERIRAIFLVPTMFNLILNLSEEAKQGGDLRSLRVMLAGGAPLLTKTKEEIFKYFSHAELHADYAATELGIVSTLKPKDQMRKIRSCGKPFTGVEITLLDAEGKEVGMGEVGAVYMKGFNTFKEYYKNPQATEESRRGDWTSVGDMARMDEEGYYYIVDREKDIVISGGVNIYPIEIDEVIQKHPKVLEVAVVGIPNEVWGESLKAVVVLKEGEKATEEEIKKFCEDKLAKYKIPRAVEFVSSLPKTPGGKIQKSVIRAQYWKDLEVKV